MSPKVTDEVTNVCVLQGKHPQHRGISDPALLGTVERYFLEIRAIPRLRQRIACCIFSRSFAAASERVRPAAVQQETCCSEAGSRTLRAARGNHSSC